MYDRFEAEIYRHASCQSGQVLILERDTEGKGKGLCLGWWQAKLCQKDWLNSPCKKGILLLLRIISRICKESRIYPALDTISAFDHHSAFICMNEICV
jgi:hypothetical protein